MQETQMPVEVFYTACRVVPNRAGEFIILAKLAYLRACQLDNANNIKLVSNSRGKMTLLKLFPDKDSKSDFVVNIWGFRFEVFSQEEAFTRFINEDIRRYTEAGCCKVCPASYAAAWTAKADIVEYVAPQHYVDPPSWPEVQNPKLFKLNPALKIRYRVKQLGFSAGRCGQFVAPIILPPFSKVSSAFVGNERFAFSYVAPAYNHSTDFFASYLKFLNVNFNSVNKVLLVAKLQLAIDATRMYLNKAQKPGAFSTVYDPYTKRYYVVIKKKIDDFFYLQIQKSTYKAFLKKVKQRACFEVLVYRSLPNDRMQNHIKKAISVVAVRGSESALEAMFYGKVIYYQYFKSHKGFIEDCITALKEFLVEDDIKILRRLFNPNLFEPLTISQPVLSRIQAAFKQMMLARMPVGIRMADESDREGVLVEHAAPTRLNPPAYKSDLPSVRRRYYLRIGVFSGVITKESRVNGCTNLETSQASYKSGASGLI
jgi:hypothetical protein